MALLCVGIIVASVIILDGTYYILQAFVFGEPDPLFKPIGWSDL